MASAALTVALLGLAAVGSAQDNIYGMIANDIDGNLQHLDKYKGQVLYVVNVATY